MMPRVIGVSILVAVCAASVGARAQETGSISEGLVTAEERCSGCHGIARGAEYSPTFGAPTFEHIALTPGMTATALSAALKTSHRTMPNLILSSDELANITAYILSMKGD
jgi:mono/diheme cytochrome c family protein